MTIPNAIDYADAPRSSANDPALTNDSLIGSPELPKLIGRAVTVNCGAQAAYARWRDLSRLQHFMMGVRQVVVLDGRRARMDLDDGKGHRAAWDLELIEDDPPRLIAWRASENGEIVHEGKVEFTPAPPGRGTVVTATLAVKGPRGRINGINEWVERLFHPDPRIQSERQLRRFKQWVETGEVSTSEPPAAAPRAF